MSDDSSPSHPKPLDLHHDATVVLVVPKSLVKVTKSALEKHKSFDRSRGIIPEPDDADRVSEQRMRVHTTISCLTWDDDNDLTPQAKDDQLLTDIQKDIPGDVIISYRISSKTDTPGQVTTHNPLKKAAREALEALPDVLFDSIREGQPRDAAITQLGSQFPDRYSVYTPLLLLPCPNEEDTWARLTQHHPAALEQVWSHIARAFKCTHIALNHPIPPSNASSSAHHQDADNILRSPVNLTPVYGDFGPAPTSSTLTAPSTQDLDNTLWVRARQNGIEQTWAPRYTMFSRGNVKEKARILALASVTAGLATPDARRAGVEVAAAADLYAGIGYFTFSYLRAGLARVLCWELNPWSIEGLARGAALNGWTTRTFLPCDIPLQTAGQTEWETWRDRVVREDKAEHLYIFAMSNDTADRILACLRSSLAPLRHVNLGLLPVSRLSWPSAVGAVDVRLGGWVHAHENVGVGEMDARRGEVEGEFQRLVDERGGGGKAQERRVRVEHVERVKMYAPGVVHAVFDVYIPGTDDEIRR